MSSFRKPLSSLANNFGVSRRSFGSTCAMSSKLRIGYVPEHFLTPLHYAQNHFNLSEHATLTPFPSGTGTMIEAFKAKEIDVGIGLTEAWVAGLSKAGKLSTSAEGRDYHIYSSYVSSPLRWAIVTGSDRIDVTNAEGLDGRRVGISRIGSGSHIMSFVLADQQGWLQQKGQLPMDTIVCGPFKPLREAVINGNADFFMWEHFTTKKFVDSHELKKIGEIPTPWNGWHIAAAGDVSDERLDNVFKPALEKGIELFKQDKTKAVEFISHNMDYSRDDAEAWYDEVRYPDQLGAVNKEGVHGAITTLQKAGVIESDESISWQTVLGKGRSA